MNLIESVKKYVKNFRGPRLNKKFIVIESDDWGSIRMPSKLILDKIVTSDPNNKFDNITKKDALESNQDLTRLMDVLSRFKDQKGNHPVITANVITGNPDFQKIKESQFSVYHVEPFTETLDRYNGRDQVIKLHQEAYHLGLIDHQFHGREHVNVRSWMAELQDPNSFYRKIFDYDTFAVEGTSSVRKRNNLMAALDYGDSAELGYLNSSLVEGISMFNQIFGIPPSSFIAPCYIWDSSVEQILKDNGINSIQGISYQYRPDPNQDWYQLKYHYTGQQNEYLQTYLVRNAFFEPYPDPFKDWVDQCLNNIKVAFRMKKPAIIGSHRVNFIGSIDQKFADINLIQFERLIQSILKNWPDVEFISSSELNKKLNDKHS